MLKIYVNITDDATFSSGNWTMSIEFASMERPGKLGFYGMKV